MRRLVGMCVFGAALTLSTSAHAQSPQASPQQTQTQQQTADENRPALTTAAGDTGLWFVPTAEVLLHKKWSISFYRTNFDDGQGFTDVSTFPVTFGVGIRNWAEIFGSWAVVTRIDRDTRPLFFQSDPAAEEETGTGGGILTDYPLARSQWFGNKLGDLWLGAKVNVLAASPDPLALALRARVKLPVGDDEAGASSGKADFTFDGVVSSYNPAVEVSGYAGVIMRGNPDGYDLTNGLRWGIGAGFPQRYSLGFRITTELFGEKYFDDTISAPAGQFGTDGSPVPTITNLRSPVIGKIGLTWQAPNGFFLGAAGSWNFTQNSRDEARPLCPAGETCAFSSEPKDDKGLQFRIGFHPGVRRQHAAPPPPPPSPPPPPPPPPVVANRPPVVKALCDPCTVEVGRTATVSADASDPDGDPLTYQWTAGAGTLSAPTGRQSPWTAPMVPGPVQFTVTVNDGKGGTASDTTTIMVTQPAQREFTFEDVHFDFDRYTLRPDALRVLDEAITAMQANPTLRLEIEGHTCNIGTTEYNLALGERRAQAVRDYLSSRGINAERLRTVSYGEERPKHDNSREETRRLNRRAALVVRLQ